MGCCQSKWCKDCKKIGQGTSVQNEEEKKKEETKKEEKIQHTKILQAGDLKDRRKSSPAKFFSSFRKSSSQSSERSTKAGKIANIENGQDSTDELTRDILTSWTIPNNGFENMINNRRGRELFGHFLEKEFSAENLRFWIACQKLESCKDNKVMRTKCEEIFVTFLDIASPQEVSLDFRVKERLSAQRQDPNREIFQEAQSKIYTLMHRDSFPRFLCSPVFKNLLQESAKDEVDIKEFSPSGSDSNSPTDNYDIDINMDNDVQSDKSDYVRVEVTDAEVVKVDDQLVTVEPVIIVTDVDPDSAQIQTDERTVSLSDSGKRTDVVSLSTLRLDTVENEFQAVLSNFMNEIATELSDFDNNEL